MSFSMDVLAMVGGTSQDMPSSQTGSIWIWIRWYEMVSSLGGSRYHIGSPNVRLGRCMVALTSVATMLDGGIKNGMLMNCLTIS